MGARGIESERIHLSKLMSYDSQQAGAIDRRAFLTNAAGLGALALGTMGAEGKGVLGNAHFAPKAKRVIFLYMAGGPSQLETFDHKPRLDRMHGERMPDSLTDGQQIAQLQGSELKCLGQQATFKSCGQSGQVISNLLPHLREVADEISVIRSMTTTQINHDPAHTFMNTGAGVPGRPSMGSWVSYGLGNLSDNLPCFTVLTSHEGRDPEPISSRQWHSGFLPGMHQGVPFESRGDAVHYLSSPNGVTPASQRRVVDLLSGMNRLRAGQVGNADITARIAQYEMAFRMQSSVPELMSVEGESRATLDAYGIEGLDGSFGANCLLARRMAERGARFIQLYHRGWDHHGDLAKWMPVSCRAVDQGCAALLRDLKQRGLLDDTLVIWGGEFGRTPMAQFRGGEPGRDHHINGFSMWMAGGGIKPGVSLGQTDVLGYHAIKDRLDVHDLHATMLHLLGIDHEALVYRYQGRDHRLTDVSGHVIGKLLA